MADVSSLKIADTTYTLKDATARSNQQALESQLGDLAYKDTASGSVTPAGTVSAPSITITPTTSTIAAVNTVGTLPTWSASVNNEILSFSFSAGTLPTTTNATVMTGASASATAPTFTGTSANVTVS